jgi:hypothetical protein
LYSHWFCCAASDSVAAHSTTRNLFKGFTGALYQLKRASDGAVFDVPTGAYGYADVAVHHAFCMNTHCTINMIYDQSERKNHLAVAPAGGHVHTGDKPVNASRLPIQMQGHLVYGAYFEQGMGYRIDQTNGMATGDAPETIYMVTSGKHVNDGCCFDCACHILCTTFSRAYNLMGCVLTLLR